jgi:CSLREA domain-containing protein
VTEWVLVGESVPSPRRRGIVWLYWGELAGLLRLGGGNCFLRIDRTVTELRTGILTSLILALGLWFGLSGSALAATFTVNSSADAPDAFADGACATAEGVCSLRAAVEEANRTPFAADQIGVSPSVTGTVTLGSTIEITAPLTISGCSADPNRPGPCLEVLVSVGAQPGLEVLADDVRISGIAFRGTSAVTLEEGQSGLRLTNNWFGVRLDGSIERSDPAGFAVTLKGPGSVIGGTAGATGTAPADRNVFASDDTKIRILGADDTTIQGNYFGLQPSGLGSFSGFSAIRIERGADGAVAEGTVIGGVPQGVAATSPACDGPCNAFARDQRGIDLDPIAPTVPGAAGATAIQGNYFAVTPSGLESESMGVGVWVGSASEVTVGGESADAANRFGWSQAAVFARSPSNLTVQGNTVGLNALGEVIHPNGDAGIWLADDLTSTVIAQNRIAGLKQDQFSDPNPTDGIVILGDGATVVGNEIGVDDSLSAPEFFTSGVYVEGDGNVIGTEHPGEGNVIRNAREAGVLIVDGQDNLVTGNRIDGSSGPAVLVEGAASLGNELAVNIGTANNGRFIELEDGVAVHEGLQPPTVVAATAGRATGMGSPGAAVLVFSRPDGGEAGDVAAFHGEARVADDGRWTLPLSPAIAGGSVVALQIASAGSSELSNPTALGPAGDVTPPVASTSGPSHTNDVTPTFLLDANEPATFLCRLDDAQWARCVSFHRLPPLGDGAHTLRVVAIDAGANTSAEVVRVFRIDTVAPDTEILAGPSGAVGSPVTFSLGSNEEVAIFGCHLDGLPEACSATWRIPLSPGVHEVQVAAVDRAGNRDPTPAQRTFTVLAAPMPTRAELLVAVRAALRRATARLRRLGPGGLLRRKRHRITAVTARSAGTFRLRASLPAGKPRAGRRTLVLTGALTRSAAGSGMLTARLTSPGRQALRRLRSPRILRLELRFTDRAGRSVRARDEIRLRRSR